MIITKGGPKQSIVLSNKAKQSIVLSNKAETESFYIHS